MIKLIEKWGSDEGISNAACVTLGLKKSKDIEKQLLMLHRKKHGTPFEFAGMMFEVECSITCARQWQRYRHLSFMEKSLRHTKPETATGMTQEYFNNYLIMYEQLLNNGMTKEDARQVLPLGTLTHFCVSGNLRSWLHFLDERQSSHAQKEIREFADSVAAFLMNYFPLTYLTWQRAKLKSCGLKDINGVELFEFDEISWHDNITKQESLGVLLYEKYDGVLTWIVKFYNDQSKVPLILVKKTMHSPEVLRV